MQGKARFPSSLVYIAVIAEDVVVFPFNHFNVAVAVSETVDGVDCSNDSDS